MRNGWIGVGAMGVAVLLAGCNAKGGRSDYANDGDTGAAAPATVMDSSRTPNNGDSTLSPRLPQATGRPGPAGDTTVGRHGGAASVAHPRDTTRKR